MLGAFQSRVEHIVKNSERFFPVLRKTGLKFFVYVFFRPSKAREQALFVFEPNPILIINPHDRGGGGADISIKDFSSSDSRDLRKFSKNFSSAEKNRYESFELKSKFEQEKRAGVL